METVSDHSSTMVRFSEREDGESLQLHEDDKALAARLLEDVAREPHCPARGQQEDR